VKVAKNFILQEFIDPEIYQLMGDKSIELIDTRIIDIAQAIRDHFNLPCIINNWHEGGGYKESGLRKFLSKTGAAFSQHKFGRAIDIKIEGVTDYDSVRSEILKKDEFAGYFRLKGLTVMESGTPTWLHIDCRFTGSEEIILIPFKA
jgi:hypothetical protein